MEKGVAKGISKWFLQLLIWVFIVLRELPESGEAYMIEKLPFFIVGVPALIMGILLPLSWNDIGTGWQVSLFVGGITIYLLAGAIAFFSASGTHLGPWYEHPGW